jgi:molybdopterin-guanine dinucleotide biosynthesis protein A
MGRDKATMLVDGVPMAVRVANALAAGGCQQVVAIGGDRQRLVDAGLVVVADRFPGEGPLGGIVTALATAPEETGIVFVASCDLPRLTGAAVHLVLDALLDDDTAEVAFAVGHRDQPLCSAWRPVALPALEHLFATGERRARAALDSLSIVRVPVPMEVLANVNTIADLHE